VERTTGTGSITLMSARNSHAAAPFLKWAGGKGQLLAQYEPFFPTAPLRAYFEPFVGSGAVFFHLRGRGLFDSYYLSETNEELVNCYYAVLDRAEDLIARLRQHQTQHSHDYYYTLRDQDRSPAWRQASLVERAARLIYLNKTCYNGLWRVNRQGHFNVPMGRYKKPEIVNEGRLRAAARALQGVHLAVEDFEQASRRAGRGDFVYLDPPYVPLSATANFTSYTQDEFGEDEHRKLALVFAELDRKGCRVMLSNSDTPFTRELYRAFRIETVSARRNINSIQHKRGAVSEVVVLNY
jgi:DNA adenine methylase